MAEARKKNIHAFVFAYPSFGHIAPALELSYLLIANGLSVTYVSSDHSISSISEHRHEEHPQLQLVGLPDGLPKDVPPIPLDYNFHQSCNSLKEPAEKLVNNIILAKESTCTHVIFTDIFVTWIPTVAQKFHLQCFPIWPASFSAFYFVCNLPTFIEAGYIPSKGDREIALSEFVDCLPELVGYRLMDLPSVAEFPGWFVDFFLAMRKIFKDSHVLLGTSFEEIEGGIIQSLRDSSEATVYPIGPLLPESCISYQGYVSKHNNSGEESKKCMEWLEMQRVGSVLYVAFGSIAMLSPEQLRILAKGIHGSGQPFLWVIRDMANPFLDLEPYNGLIISWAPQLDVLNHPSVGAFLTHCGWNSTMEAICAGVPLIAWPQAAEQPMNAKLIVEKWKVGIRLPLHPDGRTLTGSTSVTECITQIFSEDQGAALRLAISDLRCCLLKAVNKGGSAHSSLVSLIKNIRMK